ncbi:enoyl-CoA hydratase/isomerase family protein [Chloroflexota bacterium]
MVDYSRYEFINVKKSGSVAILLMNRPEKMNAFGNEEFLEVQRIFKDIDRDDEVKAAILTGAGRAFSAGGDIDNLIAVYKNPSLRLSMGNVKRLFQNLLALRKPVVAALNGDATAAGATVALCCDIVIAAENARIGDTHIRVGLVPGDGSCAEWPLLVGMCKAKEYLMTGGLVSASEAERIGLINKAVPLEKLQEEAWKIAKGLADGPAQAISWTKTCINKIILERINLIQDASLAYMYHTTTMPDHLEAAEAFLEKRIPKFKGGPV